MSPPSLSLLRALRATETIRATTLPPRQHRSPLSSTPSPSALRRPCNHPIRTVNSSAPSSTQTPLKTADRGPTSTEPTQTDFSDMDVFSNTVRTPPNNHSRKHQNWAHTPGFPFPTPSPNKPIANHPPSASQPAPTASIDACLPTGFHLDNGVKITNTSGLLLLSGEAFTWRPWLATAHGNRLVNNRGQWDTGDAAWGALQAVWPKPDLLILGVGEKMLPLAPETRRFINGLGVRVDVQDTRNAAAQFNLLATERGVGNVACALVPIGWREPR